MAWVERVPRPMDFCGHPPCPRCYSWAGGDEASSLMQFAVGLLGRAPDKKEFRKIDIIAARLHERGLVTADEPEQPKDDGAYFEDLGMASLEQHNGLIKALHQSKPVERKLTCDEIADRQADREERAKAKRKERDERLKEAREVAQVFAEADRGCKEREQYEEQRLLREVDPRFIEYCRERGIFSAQEIYSRYMRSPYMMDPLTPTRSKW